MSATQPITLITATPGGGKTALAVKLMAEAVKAGRPLFVSGIPDLKLPFIPCPPIAEWTEMRNDEDNPGIQMPYFTFPENALIVLDEAQRIFRVRASSAKVPDHVAAFETVRHTGVTFIVITQNPSFLDSHIRKLVGQHVHLRDVGMLGRWYYEWPECSDPERFATAPIKKKWSLPKESFRLYKSSSLHIKRRYSMPPSFVLLAICLLLVAFGAYRVYGSIESKTSPPELAKQGGAAQPTRPANPVSVSAAPAPVDGASYLASFTPMLPGYPESAPAYAGMRQVKSIPTVAGCVRSVTRCSCFTQQGTDAGLDTMQCRDWLVSPRFDPYRDPAEAVQALQSQYRLPLSGEPTDSRVLVTDRSGYGVLGRAGHGVRSPGMDYETNSTKQK